MLIAVCLGLFLVLTAALHTGPVVALDETTRHATSPLQRSIVLQQTSTVISTLTSMLAIAGFAVITAIVAITRRVSPRRIVMLLIAPVLSVTVAGILKEVIRRDRPTVGDGFAFPSGHATNTATLLTVLLFLAVPVTAESLARRVRLLLAVLFLVGSARLLSGEHWLTDVLAGLLLGIALGVGLTLCEAVTCRTPTCRSRRPPASS